ncbi:MAG: endolytic transglycosylase MltG [Williamsia sp.]|nr:endolytic transglycosylase MltG [Williamsia sp.]
MKKTLAIVAGLILLFTIYTGWKFFGPATYFRSGVKYLYIPSSNPTKEEVLRRLQEDSMIRSPFFFEWMASRMSYWKKIKPGKYKIESGNSAFNIVRLLRNGNQTPVNLVITKLRTREDLASLAGRKLECDSLQMIRFLTSNDSLRKYQLDTNTVMTAVFPNTYTYFWNTTPENVFSKFLKQYNQFWTPERTSMASDKGLTPQTAYILASIVEEETNKQTDKGNIASVYLNRMEKGMKLGADPTVKFALKDFGLRRIYYKHLAVESPYNTYKIYGLPPGPICTPTTATLDAVLHAPKTDYLYFVARSDFSGYHVFASTYQDHLKFAKQYQDSLNRYLQRRQPAKDNLDK